MAQLVKNLPAMQETRVRSLGWADPLEQGMATQISIPAWRIPWTEEPGGLQSMGLQRVGHNLTTKPPLDTGALGSGADPTPLFGLFHISRALAPRSL